MKNILVDLSGKISETSVSILREYDLASARFLGRDIENISIPSTKAKLIEILEREANSNQGHKIALNILQSDFYRNESYERIVEHFNALLEGLVEQF
jgi:hypothetical protein